MLIARKVVVLRAARGRDAHLKSGNSTSLVVVALLFSSIVDIALAGADIAIDLRSRSRGVKGRGRECDP